MKPYTQADAETDLRAALATGDEGAINSLAPVVDRLDGGGPNTPIMSAALWYASIGLHVFPVQAGLKTPYPKSRGCRDATDNVRQVFEWWQQHPDANVAIATGHMVDVIDFDGWSAHTSWADRFKGREWGGFTPLATVSTPRSGGMHVYVRATGEGNHQSMGGAVPGVDYRGRGGYVVAPPSVTPTGSYRFLRTLDPETL